MNCLPLVGQSSVRPKKFVSVSRLELTTASLSINMSKLIINEFEIRYFEKKSWTNIEVVLGYIKILLQIEFR